VTVNAIVAATPNTIFVKSLTVQASSLTIIGGGGEAVGNEVGIDVGDREGKVGECVIPKANVGDVGDAVGGTVVGAAVVGFFVGGETVGAVVVGAEVVGVSLGASVGDPVGDVGDSVTGTLKKVWT